MRKIIILLFVCWLLIANCADNGSSVESCVSSSRECPNIKEPISHIRKRRHLSFPTGSNLVLTLSLVKAFMVHAPSGWNLALEIDVAYHLPDSEFIYKHLRKKLHHRQKRQFWEKLQDALEFQNMNGRACIMRAVCEAKSRLAPPGRSLVHDIMRAIFTVPNNNDTEYAEEMDLHYHVLQQPEFCDTYDYEKDCPVSIIDFVFSLNKQK